jgi:hypothetical protein
LTRIAASAAIVVSLVEAVDSLEKGNNIAVLGNMLVGCAGVVNVLSKGGLPGLIAAGIVLVGVLVIYFSLNEDEKFLLGFFDENKGHWSSAKYAHEHRFLKRANHFLGTVDDYLKIRGSSI